MVGKGTNRKSMNYVENVAAFIQFCIENEEKLPCFEKEYDGTSAGKQHLFNYCDEPAYDMNFLVLPCTSISESRRRALSIFRTGLRISAEKASTCLCLFCTRSLQSTQSV